MLLLRKSTTVMCMVRVDIIIDDSWFSQKTPTFSSKVGVSHFGQLNNLERQFSQIHISS